MYKRQEHRHGATGDTTQSAGGYRYRIDGGRTLRRSRKKIRNWCEPLDGNDAVPLQFVQDHCLLVNDDDDPTQDSNDGVGGVITRIDVKGRKLANVGTPTDLKDAVNKQYVDYTLSLIHI